jgi:putative acetyltransferase
MFTIRPEMEDDAPAIRRVNEQAFGQPGEADLVDALRLEARPFVSLVADREGEVVGHIAFSPVTIDGRDVGGALGLAPMAVLPAFQGQGIGSALVREGLAACRRAGCAAVFVLGHAHYYPRLGFVPAPPRGLRCAYPVPDDVFMVAELQPGALDGVDGLVRYHPTFARFG